MLALGVAIVLAACRPSVEGSWRLVDLTALEPEVTGEPRLGGPTWERRVATLGQSGVATPAGQVRAIAQAGGTRMTWSIQVGATPVLRVVPLTAEGPGGSCSFAVETARGDARPTVHTSGAITRAQRHPTPLTLDLAGHAEGAVDITFVAVGTCRVLWGSPSLAFREWAPRPGSLDPKRPNVLLITADTLRADAVGPWRKGGSITPALDQLAAESDVWLEAHSTFNSTNPSFASMMTGLYGKDHGVYDLKTPLPAGRTTLAELFAEAGYRTEAVISASHLAPRLGQGFERLIGPEDHFAAEMAVETSIAWLDQQRDPFFHWLHLFDPHTPHTPPRPYAEGLLGAMPSGFHPPDAWRPFRTVGSPAYAEPTIGGDAALYEGEVAYLDRQIDRLLDFLRSRRLLENTIVVFVSDHGENLGDHGIDYRHTGLWDSTLHVPLMIRWPGPHPVGREIPGLVQHLDLFPTLLTAAGLSTPDQDGLDLRRLAAASPPGRPMVFSEHADRFGATVRTATARFSRVYGGLRLTIGPALYDLDADPGERRNLASTGRPEEARLSALLTEWAERRRPEIAAAGKKITEEERRRLEALGYN